MVLHTRVLRLAIGAAVAGVVLVGCGGDSDVQEEATTTIESDARPVESDGVGGCPAPTLEPTSASVTIDVEVWVYVDKCEEYSVNVIFDPGEEVIPVQFVDQPDTGQVLVKFGPANPGTWNPTVVHYNETTDEMSTGTVFALEVRD